MPKSIPNLLTKDIFSPNIRIPARTTKTIFKTKKIVIALEINSNLRENAQKIVATK